MTYGANSRNGTGLVNTGFNIAALSDPSLGLRNEGPTIPGQIASWDVYRAAVADSQARGPRKPAHGVDFHQKKTWGITNTSLLNLNDELTLRNIISYQHFTSNYSVDSDGTVLQQQDDDPRRYPAPGQASLPGDGTPLTYANATLARLEDQCAHLEHWP